MDGKLRAIHVVWISAIPAEMTRSAGEKELELKHLYNQDILSQFGHETLILSF
jgi:hypothetical protein